MRNIVAMVIIIVSWCLAVTVWCLECAKCQCQELSYSAAELVRSGLVFIKKSFGPAEWRCYSVCACVLSDPADD